MPLPVHTLPPATVMKEATQPIHTDVENLLMPKLQAMQSTVDYATILKMFYGYFSPLENLIQQYITTAELPDIEQRRKASAILHDLTCIGQAGNDLPLCHHLPAVTTITQAFGALYVLEGSTLGGKMIAKMLLKNESLFLSENALTFFSGYKEETGSKWKSFLAVFNQQKDIDMLVQSANDTFRHLKSWMQQSLYHD